MPTAKRPRGRPPLEDRRRTLITLEAALLLRLDSCAAAQQISRSEAARRAIAAWCTRYELLAAR